MNRLQLNKRNIFTLIIFVVAMLLGTQACTDKFDIEEATSSLGENKIDNIGDTLYIQQSPNWTGFNNPKDMIFGKDQFIYVADTDNDRIVMMNIAGQILGIKEIRVNCRCRV